MKRLAPHTAFSLVVLLILSPTAHNQTDNNRNGNWWISQAKEFKVAYVVGFFDGLQLGRKFSYWSTLSQDKKDVCVAKAIKSFDSYNSKYLEGVTSGQLADGLDQFYSDYGYRNRRIEVNDGVWLVLNSIAGKFYKR